MDFEDKLPNGRTEWATVKWQQSQSLLGRLLNSYNFMKFEELRISTGSRADIVVIRTTQDEVIFGIIEVKTYTKINSTIEKNAIKQICRYVSNIYDLISENSRWGNRNKRYFGSIVYTNDYPVSTSANYDKLFNEHLPDELLEKNNVHVFITRPEELIKILQKQNLCGYAQDTLTDYFK
ncbi:MAG: hypothetical protein ACW99A_05795 [Candidatus Kariarchaeaceae archaeon]